MFHLIRKRKTTITALLIIADIIISLLIRGNDQRFFARGTVACMIILSFIPLLFSRGINFVVSILVAGLMWSLWADRLWGSPPVIGINDILFFAAVITIGVIYYFIKRPALLFDLDTAILLLIIIIKLISQNSLAVIENYNGVDERYVFYIGDSITHFLFAVYAFKNLDGIAGLLAGIFWGLTVNYAFKMIWGDPYHFELNEIPFIVYTFCLFSYSFAEKYYPKKIKQLQLVKHVFIALHLFLAGIVAIYIFK